MNANKAITEYNTPITAYANYQYWTDLSIAQSHYGDDLDLENMKF